MKSIVITREPTDFHGVSTLVRVGDATPSGLVSTLGVTGLLVGAFALWLLLSHPGGLKR